MPLACVPCCGAVAVAILAASVLMTLANVGLGGGGETADAVAEAVAEALLTRAEAELRGTARPARCAGATALSDLPSPHR